jgi:hypothetical protein
MCPFENKEMCTLEFFRLVNYKNTLCKKIKALVTKHNIPWPVHDIRLWSYEKLHALYDDVTFVDNCDHFYVVQQLVERLKSEHI